MDERVNRSNYVGFGDKNDRNRCDVRMGRGDGDRDTREPMELSKRRYTRRMIDNC